MTLPTPLESRAGARYSTSAEMHAFLHALCAQAPDRARLEAAPGSTLPVLVCAPPRGAPALRVMLVGSLHGASEAAPGEALLALARDVLCGPDAGLADGLELIVIPCPNPAGRDRDSARNAAGVNLNRDFVLLGQTESRALDAALRHYAPDVLLDAHESAVLKRKTLGQEGWLTAFGAQWDVPVAPAAAPAVRALTARTLLPALLAGVQARGLPAQRYVAEIRSTAQPVTHGHLTLRALRNKAAAHGIASVLLETPMEPKADPHPSFRNIVARAARQRLCMGVFLDTVRAHAPAVRAARCAAQADGDANGGVVAGSPAPAIALGARYVSASPGGTVVLPLTNRASGACVQHHFADHRTVQEDPPVPLPAAYWLTAHTDFFADWLARHGVSFTRAPRALTLDARWERYAPPDASGAFAVASTHAGARTLPAGSLRVDLSAPPPGTGAGTMARVPPGGQRRLAALLLEPRSASSLFSHPPYAALVRPGQDGPLVREPASPG